MGSSTRGAHPQQSGIPPGLLLGGEAAELYGTATAPSVFGPIGAPGGFDPRIFQKLDALGDPLPADIDQNELYGSFLSELGQTHEFHLYDDVY